MQALMLVVSLALIMAVIAQTRREQRSIAGKILRGAAGIVLFSTLNLVPLSVDGTLNITTIVVLYVVAALVAVALYLAGHTVADHCVSIGD